MAIGNAVNGPDRAPYLAKSGGTMTGNLILNADPTNPLGAATKQFVESLGFTSPCRVSTQSNLVAIYDNGVAGIGASLTNNGALVALVIDGKSMALNDRVLVRMQNNAFENGVYTVSNIGSGSVAWVLTRATDYDQPSDIQTGDFIIALVGDSSLDTPVGWIQVATVTTIGVDNIAFFPLNFNLVVSMQNLKFNYSLDTGTANNYVATLLLPPFQGYIGGLFVVLKVANTNTGASTLDVNGFGSQAIKDNLGNDLQAGDMPVGFLAYLISDGTNFILINRNYEKRAQDDSFNFSQDLGVANVYTANLNPPATAYVDGMRLSLRILNTNTGDSTVNVDGLGAATIALQDGSFLSGGELDSGMIADLRYDSPFFQLLNPLRPFNEVKNFIYGGNFSTNPWQRNTSIAGLTGTLSTYVADRFKWQSVGSGVVTYLRTVDAPTVTQAGILSQHCLHIDVTTADAAIAATDFYAVGYIMEGADWSQLAQRPFAISFWHKHTITGTYCVAFQNSGSDRSYVAEYTQAVTNNWEYTTITVPASPSAGTWDYTSGVGLRVYFTCAAGSNFNTTANAWQTGNFISTSNQVNNMSANANNFKLQLVQINEGYKAYNFIVRPESEEITLCQRYYEKSYDLSVVPGTVTNVGASYMACARAFTTGEDMYFHKFQTRKRTSPTITFYSSDSGATGTVYNIDTTADVNVNSLNIGTSGAVWTANAALSFVATNRVRGHWVADSEL